jgi:hypothetical protein
MLSTEKETRLLKGLGPEVNRQDAPINDQERAIPRQLPCQQLQPKERRQATRDDILDGKQQKGRLSAAS